MQMLGDLDIDGSSQLPRQMLGPESSVEVHERGGAVVLLGSS